MTQATGIAEREARDDGTKRRGATLGADKGYDTRDFVEDLRQLNITPHVAQNTTRRASAIDGRTTRHAGYAVSQQKRKRIEEGGVSIVVEKGNGVSSRWIGDHEP